jgi:hypothetical protein
MFRVSIQWGGHSGGAQFLLVRHLRGGANSDTCAGGEQFRCETDAQDRLREGQRAGLSLRRRSTSWAQGMDRATRSMMDGIHILERVHARGAMAKILDKPHLDLTTTLGKGLLAFLSGLAQDERERILKRAHDGRAAARARGARMGRKPAGSRASPGRGRERPADRPLSQVPSHDRFAAARSLMIAIAR